jgi:pimeloyl-ACP methyl ester carboxylesterase
MHTLRNRLGLIGLAALLIIGFAPVYKSQGQGKVTLTPCTITFGLAEAAQDMPAQCADVPVPEDWSAPTGKQITLSVAVLPARVKATGAPIFHFEGGPGAGAIKSFGEIWFSAYELFRDAHDVVLIDQRGTGDSAPLQCTEFTEQALADLAVDFTPEAELAEAQKRLAACLTRVSEITDPAFVTSTSLANDTNAVRLALGYDQINLFGSSYGAWLAQYYLALHGETVQGAIIEGTVGPWNNPWLVIPNNWQAGLETIFALCQKDAQCNFIYPNLPRLLERTLARLEDSPVETSGLSSRDGQNYPVLVTKARFLFALQALVNQGPLVGSVPEAIFQASVGNFAVLASIMVASAEQDISVGMYWSIVCSETVQFYTDAQLAEAKQGSYYGLADSFMDSLRPTCAQWRSAELDPKAVSAAQSERPVLIFSGLLDTQTPPAFAKETNQRFPNSTLVTFAYEGHGVMPFSRCAQNLAKSFFADANQTLDTTCAANNVAPGFNGGYKLEFADVATESGDTVSLPVGWQALPNNTANTALSFYADANNTSLLALASLPAQSFDDAALAEINAAIAGQYAEPPILQATVNTSGITISQYSLSTETEALTGALVVFSIGDSTSVVWYAAPNNTFTASFGLILPKVLLAGLS